MYIYTTLDPTLAFALVMTLPFLLVVQASPLFPRRNVGEATVYAVGGAPGSCGQNHTDAEMVVAMHVPQCGKQISATYQGKTIQVTVVDTCPGCAEMDLDLSPTAFGHWGDPGPLGPGRLYGVEWDYV
ncbi:DPBB1 domain-containing protein [Stygiomarasmius scandens]|uniref:DPBB1 domain-containing protein n=1 Tax=Marasmiellus scandens TaxID=2682957 RepID=A0ABR1JHQ1_9AGAR